MVISKGYITTQKQVIFPKISLWLYARQVALKKKHKRVRSQNFSVRSELKIKYITVKDPLNVCQNLNERFDYHKQEILANASKFFTILSSTFEWWKEKMRWDG